MKKSNEKFKLAFLAEKALKEAVREVIQDHKREGNPIAVWKNGKVVQIPAKELKG
jgi:hypothetical protein